MQCLCSHNEPTSNETNIAARTKWVLKNLKILHAEHLTVDKLWYYTVVHSHPNLHDWYMNVRPMCTRPSLLMAVSVACMKMQPNTHILVTSCLELMLAMIWWRYKATSSSAEDIALPSTLMSIRRCSQKKVATSPTATAIILCDTAWKEEVWCITYMTCIYEHSLRTVSWKTLQCTLP